MIRNVAMKLRRVENHFQLLNKEAVSVQKISIQKISVQEASVRKIDVRQ